SSRRRHTRFSRDWSSDVCSSDLWSMHEKWLEDGLAHPDGISSIRDWTMSGQLLELIHNREYDGSTIDDIGDIITGKKPGRQSEEIGRASCRERAKRKVDVVGVRW